MKHLPYWVFAMTTVAAAPLLAHAETREYNLTIGSRPISVGGHMTPKITINGTMPGPILRFAEGDDAVVHVTNTLKADTSIHWHGMVVPGSQDGVPGFNGFDGIKPGQTFTYRFHIKQSGTYWYHAHSIGQEQDGLLGGLVIDPAAGSKDAAMTVPADKDYVIILSDESPETAAQIQAHLKGNADYYQYHRRTVGDYFHDVKTMGFAKATQMAGMWGKMNMRPTDLADVEGYTFEINGLSPQENWTGLFKPGEKVKLRFINAGAMTMFDVRIPGLKMTVVAADGQPVEPVTVDEFRMGNAETYDVIVEPTEDKAYTIAAESLDRTGFALGTLAPREGMRGDVPAQRPRAILTMSDMNMAKMMKDDPNMDMSLMDQPSGWSDAHAPAGTKILAYSDLKYAGEQADAREPTRDIKVVLDGNMERYVWTMNGKTFDPAEGIHVAYNERVRLTYVNDSMMAHPMHLHGMFVQLENGQPVDKMPNKHTVIVPPGQTVSVLLTADNEGTWAFHCHLMNHMISGMMTDLVVEEPGAPPPASPPHDTMPGMDMPGTSMPGMKMDKPQQPPAGASNDAMPGMTMSAPDAAGPSNGPKATGSVSSDAMPGMDMKGDDTTANTSAKDHDQHDSHGPSMNGMDMGASSGAQPAHPKKSPPKPKKTAPAKPAAKHDMSMPGMDMSHMDMGQTNTGKDQGHAH
ncbi:multicopper oxidase domain-containing protein [Asticcacaulis sp.]|uniref:multicopper oxidase domain-containing protein n=1 Tax=Asticcacaulis sp. TaxID=1872648 RepID=UPI003F7CBB2E